MENLLSLLFELKSEINKPIRSRDWYGKAAQAIFLSAVRDAYSGRFAKSMHKENQLRAYTVSSLFSDSHINGWISPDSRYFMRFTALNTETEQALFQTVQPGASLCEGALLDLAKAPFRVRTFFWEPEKHPLAQFTSYEKLWDETIQSADKLTDSITLSFTSPTFFKSTEKGCLTALPTAARTFGSLLGQIQTVCDQLGQFSRI